MKKLLIFLLAISLATTAFAAEKLNIRKFAGLNTRLNPFEIQDNESPDMSNFVLDEAGSLTERSLFKHYNTTSIGAYPITNLYKFYKSSDAGYFICASNTQLYNATAGALTSVVTANTVVSNSEWEFESFTDGTNELVYAANIGTPLLFWNGTTSSFQDMAPENDPAENCKLLKKHKSRLFAAGSNEYPYRLYYSSLSNGKDWNTSGGTIDLPSYERIMKLEVLSDVLCIFTRNTIYALYGWSPNEFVLQKTLSEVGTHASKSVVRGDKTIFFLNKSGVFVFDGVNSVNISEPIIPTIDAISSTYLDKAAGLYDNHGRYWLMYTSTSGTYNDSILIYDTVLKQWYPLDGLNFSAMFKTEGGSDKGELYGGASDNTGWLWQREAETSAERITHSTKTQLATGVTSNTVFWGTETNPQVRLRGDAWGDWGDGTSTDTDTKLLLHFDGADGAVATTDSSLSGHVITFGDDAQLDTAQYVFGTASVLLDGAVDTIGTGSSADFTLGMGDFTLELWARFNDISSDNTFISCGGSVTPYWSFRKLDSQYINFYDNGGNGHFTFPYTFNLNEWYHIALVRHGSDCLMFINGVLKTPTQLTAFDDLKPTALTVGSIGGDIHFFNGWIDEVRVTKGVARYLKDFTPHNKVSNGTLTSDNIQINASGQTTLGAINWNDELPANTYIQFSTRTGTTDDTVDWNGWETWVSASSVTINTVTSSTVWESTDTANFVPTPPLTRQPMNVTYYESWDEVSPNCVAFQVSNDSVSLNDSAYMMTEVLDLSTYKWIGYWLKSPVTGDSVNLSIGEVSGTVVAYTTANTVEKDTWEYHYWNINNYTSTDIDAIQWMEIKYLGVDKGQLVLGEVDAYDFYEKEETITSTPNDWIQYQAIMGTTNTAVAPYLKLSNEIVVSLSYSIAGSVKETEMTSYWVSKPFDFQKEYNKNFQYLELTAETSNPTTGNTVSLLYDFDDGMRTGTMTDTFPVTGQRVKLRFYFPSGSYGKEGIFTIKDEDVDSAVKIHNMVVGYTLTGGVD